MAAALYYTLTSAYSSQFFARNITGFVCFGDTGLPARYLPPHALVDPNGPGYDGQFHFMVAQDLLGSGEVGQFVDNPAYRYQRILYPALAAVWARGDVALLPSALLKLNLLAVAATTALLAWMLRRRQLPPWYALIYPLFSSLVLATLRDLSEPTALFFLVLSLHFYLEARVVGTAAALALAILGRETALALVPVLVLDAMWHRRGTRAALVSAAALGPFALWSGYLYSQFGQLGLGVGERVFAAPLVAMVQYATQLFTLGRPLSADPLRYLFVANGLQAERAYFVLLALALGFSLAVAVRALNRRPSAITLGLLGFSLMPLLMSDVVWQGEVWSFGRVQILSQTLLLVHFVERGDRFALIPLWFHVVATGVCLDQLGLLG